jgi:hypothetical protein
MRRRKCKFATLPSIQPFWPESDETRGLLKPYAPAMSAALKARTGCRQAISRSFRLRARKGPAANCADHAARNTIGGLYNSIANGEEERLFPPNAWFATPPVVGKSIDFVRPTM